MGKVTSVINDLVLDSEWQDYYEAIGPDNPFVEIPSSFDLSGKLETVSDALKELSQAIGYVGFAFKMLDDVLTMFGVFQADPCPGNDRAFLEANLKQLQLQLSTVNQILELGSVNGRMIGAQLQHAMLAIKHHQNNIQLQNRFKGNVEEFEAFANSNWISDQYTRHGLKNTCEGLLMAVETMQKETYSTSQLLHTTMGKTYVPSYFTLPPSWNSANQDFDTYPAYGFYVSLWDNLSNFKLQTPDFYDVDELEKETDVDEILREKVNEVRNDDDIEPINSTIQEMSSSYGNLIAESLNGLKSALSSQNSLPTNFESFTYVVKALKRSPCSFVSENTEELACDSEGNNCSEEEIFIEQPRYCDRSSVEITADECVGGDCPYGDLADVFLSKGVVKFKIEPEDLALSGFKNIVEDSGFAVSPPIVHKVYFKVYYADRWCLVDAVDGVQTNCCETPDFDIDGEAGKKPLECPTGFVSNNFDFFSRGFEGENEGQLAIINAAAEGLVPLHNGKANCPNVQTVRFEDPVDEGYIAMNTCTEPLLSWPEKMMINWRSPVSTTETNSRICVDYWEDFSENISLPNLKASTIRGLPVLGSWYLVYDGRRADAFTDALRTSNLDYGLSIPRNNCYNRDRDDNAPEELLDQLGSEYDTPYSFYRREYGHDESKDINKISRIDLVFVVAKLPSPVSYWQEVE